MSGTRGYPLSKKLQNKRSKTHNHRYSDEWDNSRNSHSGYELVCDVDDGDWYHEWKKSKRDDAERDWYDAQECPEE